MSTIPNAPQSIPTAASPIADLTYRTYDGPLHLRATRWWTIAISRIRYLRTRWWFWVLVALSVTPYIFIGIMLYIQSQIPPGQPTPPNPFIDNTPNQRFAFQFFNGLNWQAFWLFLPALACGAGAIASDNRANALQVYLSKPLTKRDYLIGKWMGIFVTLYTIAVVPALILYLYCLMSYSSDGFLKNEPWILVRVLVSCTIPATIHASLLVGFSAWSKTPLMAGITYAGIYFITGTIKNAVWLVLTLGRPDKALLVQFMSIGGVINGLLQNTMGITIHLQHFRRKHGQVLGMENLSIHPPSLWIMLSIAAALVLLGITAARMRIRAVEVVQG